MSVLCCSYRHTGCSLTSSSCCQEKGSILCPFFIDKAHSSLFKFPYKNWILFMCKMLLKKAKIIMWELKCLKPWCILKQQWMFCTFNFRGFSSQVFEKVWGGWFLVWGFFHACLKEDINSASGIGLSCQWVVMFFLPCPPSLSSERGTTAGVLCSGM